MGNYMEGINFSPYPQDGSTFTTNSLTIGGTAAGAGNVIAGQMYGAGVYTNARVVIVGGIALAPTSPERSISATAAAALNFTRPSRLTLIPMRPSGEPPLRPATLFPPMAMAARADPASFWAVTVTTLCRAT
ncbi:MAG: hypothetical protein ABI217_05565 [Chthoniobacterales bacterium]